jgi:hypothetical protein
VAIKRRVKSSPKAIARKKMKVAQDALTRMGEILAAGHGDEDMVRIYFTHLYTDHLKRLQSIATRAEKERNWDFMHDSILQATELYVLAAALYEKFPEHTILSDGAFDGLARWLFRQSNRADNEFWVWYNITSMGLKAGTGYNVILRPPILWMVYLLTGQELEADNGTRTHDKDGVLRKPVKRKRKPTKSDGREPPRRIIRKRKKRN